MEGEFPVKYLVVDAGGFIINAPIREIGEEIYTLNAVVTEIRDKATRERLQVLPYELHFKEPTPQAIKSVSDFAKKTGDYPSLSAVDLRVLGLVYELEKEHVGTEHIKQQPDQKILWNTTKKVLEKPTDIAGFYIAPKHKPDSKSETSSQCTEVVDSLEDTSTEKDLLNNPTSTESVSSDTDIIQQVKDLLINENQEQNVSESTEHTKTESENECTTENSSYSCDNDHDDGDNRYDSSLMGDEPDVDAEPSSDKVAGSPDSGTGAESCDQELLETEEQDIDIGTNEEEEEDDGLGWITPSNIQQMKEKMKDDSQQKANVTVGCITTDFAMQNVLIQMGLNVLSVDGMLIKKAKSYILRCHACMKTTKIMTKVFCPNCGNKTLQKVACRVNDDGSVQYFLSRKKPVNSRGLRYSIPLPKGGKYNSDPILCEDQTAAHQRMSKAAKVKYDIMDPDYMARSSPFAPTDLTSKSSLLGIRNYKHGGRNRRNPNENRKNYGRRK